MEMKPIYEDQILPDVLRKSLDFKIQEGENAIKRVKMLEAAIACYAREELGNMNFEEDSEAVEYILSFLEENCGLTIHDGV